MLVCNDCELHYEVVWHLDNLNHDEPDQYCPRCGSDNLEEEDDT